jgi:transglutaminase-like putative cysteine protease
MIAKSYLLFTILLLFLCSAGFSQPAKISIGKEPAWITKNNIDYSRTLLDKNAEDGYIDVSYEGETSLADQCKYIRRSIKIISQAGVQNGSEISVPYDPSFEQLTFHSIHIIRGSDTLNRLDLSKIKTVHQEADLNDFIYNGTLNAILILDDVRQGDIIEYSYSIKGFNPIFKNKFSDVFSMQYSVPMYQLYYKLVVPAGRKINIKNLNDTIQPVITTVKGQQVYEWKKNNLQPLILQDYAPTWYDPYAQVLISEYNSWKELNDWAKQLFPLNKNLSTLVVSKIKSIEAADTSDDERTKDALQFVQDDIRYMGIEMGEHSHKPADPSKVFAQRFGDCKEKSYLLCCMLNAMKIEANIVLINTDKKKNIVTLLPSPTDFDHATVRIKLDSAYYYFDPTISYQRGDIKHLFYPDYQAGFVITDTTTAVTPIFYRNLSYQHITEKFTVPAMTGGGTLIAITTFHGGDADDIRNDFNSESVTDILTRDQKFYAKYYEDIKADSLVYKDNDSTGIFTTTEYYTIPDFWTTDKDSVEKFTLAAFTIDNVLRRPKEKERTMPFGLDYPTRYEEEVSVDLPQDWTVTESQTHLKNGGFGYNDKFYGNANHIYLQSDYQNFKDNVTIDETPAYFKSLDEYDDKNNFEISYNPNTKPDNTQTVQTPSPAGSSTTSIIYVIALTVPIMGFIYRRKRKKK